MRGKSEGGKDIKQREKGRERQREVRNEREEEVRVRWKVRDNRGRKGGGTDSSREGGRALYLKTSPQSCGMAEMGRGEESIW